MRAEATTEPRTAAGRFAYGHSGNPAGRPKGARNRATLAAEALLAENAEGLAQKLVDDALGGDGPALRFALARLCPAATGRPVALDLAPGREGDLLHIHGLLMRGLADGEITPDEASAVARVLAVGAKLIELQRKLRRDAARGQGEAARAEQPKHPSRPQPVSDLYSAAELKAESKAGSESPLPNPSPQAGEGDERPVSNLYFSRAALRASTTLARPPVSDLYFSRAAA
jgi:hypothetical protein